MNRESAIRYGISIMAIFALLSLRPGYADENTIGSSGATVDIGRDSQKTAVLVITLGLESTDAESHTQIPDQSVTALRCAIACPTGECLANIGLANIGLANIGLANIGVDALCCGGTCPTGACLPGTCIASPCLSDNCRSLAIIQPFPTCSLAGPWACEHLGCKPLCEHAIFRSGDCALCDARLGCAATPLTPCFTATSGCKSACDNTRGNNTCGTKRCDSQTCEPHACCAKSCDDACTGCCPDEVDNDTDLDVSHELTALTIHELKNPLLAKLVQSLVNQAELRAAWSFREEMEELRDEMRDELLEAIVENAQMAAQLKLVEARAEMQLELAKLKSENAMLHATVEFAEKRVQLAKEEARVTIENESLRARVASLEREVAETRELARRPRSPYAEPVPGGVR